MACVTKRQLFAALILPCLLLIRTSSGHSAPAALRVVPSLPLKSLAVSVYDLNGDHRLDVSEAFAALHGAGNELNGLKPRLELPFTVDRLADLVTTAVKPNSADDFEPIELGEASQFLLAFPDPLLVEVLLALNFHARFYRFDDDERPRLLPHFVRDLYGARPTAARNIVLQAIAAEASPYPSLFANTFFFAESPEANEALRTLILAKRNANALLNQFSSLNHDPDQATELLSEIFEYDHDWAIDLVAGLVNNGSRLARIAVEVLWRQESGFEYFAELLPTIIIKPSRWEHSSSQQNLAKIRRTIFGSSPADNALSIEIIERLCAAGMIDKRAAQEEIDKINGIDQRRAEREQNRASH